MRDRTVKAPPAMPDKFTVPDKDPEYIYRWCNNDDRAMLAHQNDGYEVVIDDKPEINRGVQQAESQPLASSGGVTRRRGPELILMRIRKDRHAETVGARREYLAAHHRGALDGAVEQANEAARQQLSERNMRAPKSLVFQSTDDENLSQHLRG